MANASQTTGIYLGCARALPSYVRVSACVRARAHSPSPVLLLRSTDRNWFRILRSFASGTSFPNSLSFFVLSCDKEEMKKMTFSPTDWTELDRTVESKALINNTTSCLVSSVFYVTGWLRSIRNACACKVRGQQRGEITIIPAVTATL